MYIAQSNSFAFCGVAVHSIVPETVQVNVNQTSRFTAAQKQEGKVPVDPITDMSTVVVVPIAHIGIAIEQKFPPTGLEA